MDLQTISCGVRLNMNTLFCVILFFLVHPGRCLLSETTNSEVAAGWGCYCDELLLPFPMSEQQIYSSYFIVAQFFILVSRLNVLLATAVELYGYKTKI